MIASPDTVPIRTINLSSGSHLLIEQVSWEQYEALLDELGKNRHSPRINYYNGTLELMAPLPTHERPHRMIADIVKTLLDAEERSWEDFGNGKLTIYGLQQRGYAELQASPTFPDLPMLEMIPHLVQQAFQEGTSKMLRSLRQQLSQQ